MSDATVTRGRTVLDGEGVRAAIEAMGARLRDIVPDLDHAAFVGIRRLGVPLAQRLGAALDSGESDRNPLGELDITLYRDDLSTLGPQPVVERTELAFDVDDRTVILVDDVLFTGRTVRAALEALTAHGRPRAVRLAVLVDRGHREYPIQPDVAGLVLDTRADENVHVQLAEFDGHDLVTVSGT